MSPVLPGHSDECAACNWEQLTEEDKAVLEPAAFRQHRRQDPPPKPALQSRRRSNALWALAAAAVPVSAMLGGSALAVGWACALLFAAAALFAAYPAQERKDQALAKWDTQVRLWEAGQTQAWLQERAKGQLWPCPRCGSLTCPNQHSATTTRGVKIGPFYGSRSHTDPA